MWAKRVLLVAGSPVVHRASPFCRADRPLPRGSLHHPPRKRSRVTPRRDPPPRGPGLRPQPNRHRHPHRRISAFIDHRRPFGGPSCVHLRSIMVATPLCSLDLLLNSSSAQHNGFRTHSTHTQGVIVDTHPPTHPPTHPRVVGKGKRCHRATVLRKTGLRPVFLRYCWQGLPVCYLPCPPHRTAPLYRTGPMMCKGERP